MAKSSNRGAGPGTNDRGGVRSTLDPPFKGGADKGSGNGMRAPFDQGSSDGNLPQTVYAPSMPGPGKSAAFSSRDVPGTILTDPKGPRR